MTKNQIYYFFPEHSVHNNIYNMRKNEQRNKCEAQVVPQA